MSPRHHGLHVLITGAARGIGEALARRYAPEIASTGGLLSLVDLDEQGLKSLIDDLPCSAVPYTVDLSETDELPDLIDRIRERGGPLDLVVNNAGIMEVRSVAGFSWDLAERLLRVDLIAPLRISHAVLPEMRARGEGTIVNVASMAGVTPLRGCAFYGAAKAGLAMASEILNAEVRADGVHVMTVYPGPVATDLERGARSQLGRSALAELIPLGRAEVLARRIHDGVRRRRARVVYPGPYEIARQVPTVASWITSRLAPAPRM